jgi:hypothetical protein
MNGACERCAHYRRVKPASQLMARLLGTVDEKIAEALTKMSEDEQKQRDAEAEYKKQEALREGMSWGARPLMSAYCGYRERYGEYLIAEVKNRGLQCEDFTDQPRPIRPCESCAHRVPSGGWAADEELEQQYGQMAVQAVSAQASPQTAEGLLSRHREGAAGRRAFEASGAYIAKGVMATEPQYLDWCRKLSQPGEYVVCVLQNPHATCDLWCAADQDGAGVAAPAAPDPAGAAGPAQATATSDLTAAAPSKDGPAVGRLTAFLEWIVGVSLPTATRGLLQVRVAAGGEQQFADWLAYFSDVEALPEDERLVAREQMQEQFIASLRGSDDQLAASIVGTYDSANAPIAPGSPPLTTEAADAVLAIFDFLAAVVNGVDAVDVSPELLATWRMRLAQAYPSLGPLEQQWIAAAPLTAAMMRAGWDDLAPEQQVAQRQAWSLELPRQQAFIQQVMQAPAADPWAAAQAFAPPPDPFGAVPAAPAEEKSLPDLFDAMASAQDAELAKLERSNPELAMQKRMQDKQVRATLFSNMLQMQHQTMMGIIGNIK